MRFTVVTTTKNECPYMLEWIAHYRVLGFDDIVVITNDNTDPSLELYQALAQAGYIRFYPHVVPRTQRPQKNAYQIAVREVVQPLKDGSADGSEFILTADADEFLFVNGSNNIAQLGEFLDTADAMFINWKCYGSQGYETRPAGLVMEAYNKRGTDGFRGNKAIKSFFRVLPTLESFTAHFPIYSDSPSRKFIWSDGEIADNSIIGSESYKLHARAVFGKAYIRHYSIKSAEEYRDRQARGRPAVSANRAHERPRYTDEYFNIMDQNSVNDPVEQAHIQQVREVMEQMYYDNSLWRHHDLFLGSYFGLAD